MNFIGKLTVGALIGYQGVAASLDDGKCRALVLSGGASWGAWEIGVLWGLARYGNPDDFHWDVLSGISAGSINTAGLVLWAPEDVVEMTQWMSDVWASLTTDQILLERPEGILNSFLFGESIFDDSPALDFMTNLMQPFGSFKKRFTVGAVDVGTGAFTTFN